MYAGSVRTVFKGPQNDPPPAALELLRKYTSKKYMKNHEHVIAKYVDDDASQEKAYPGVIINNKSENEFRIKFKTDGSTCLVSTSDVEHPYNWVISNRLDVSPKKCSNLPINVIRLIFSGLPSLGDCAVFFITKERKLGTGADIAIAVEEGKIQTRNSDMSTVNLEAPSLDIEGCNYRYEYDMVRGGRLWNMTKARSPRKRESRGHKVKA